MKKIKLSQGYVTIVDDNDYTRLLKGNKWFARIARHKDGTLMNVYAVRSITINGKRTAEYMHRFILGVAKSKVEIDHIDYNGLNNTRRNLRIASILQNRRHKRRRSDNTSGHVGVNIKNGKWIVRISTGDKRKYLGAFSTIEAAIKVYDKAAKKYHGKFKY